jgi:ketosteroid isomerase-like protein
MPTANAITQDEVRSFLKRFVDLYDKADKKFFDLFAPDATIFALSSSTRYEGRAAFEKGFGPNFKADNRGSEIVSPEIKVLGDTALVSYYNRIQAGGKRIEMRSSLALSRDQKGGLAVTHLHNSPLNATGVTSVPAGRSIEDVMILEERVATAIAAIGTPK